MSKQVSKIDKAAYRDGRQAFEDGDGSLREIVEDLQSAGPRDEDAVISYAIGFLDGALDALRSAVAR